MPIEEITAVMQRIPTLKFLFGRPHDMYMNALWSTYQRLHS